MKHEKVICAITECSYNKEKRCKALPFNRIFHDAADAIEALQAEAQDAAIEYTIVCKKLDELKSQLPNRGEWIEDTTTYAGPGLSNYKCSLCGKICGTWRRGLKQNELPNWCGNCGADMRAKMEVQDG